MKKLLGTLVLGISCITASYAQQEMVLEGTYQGANIYVQNPFSSSGVGFCVVNVTINGQQSIDEINSSAFEIDFSSYQLKRGAPVEVKIEYKDECNPTVLNPDVIKPTSTYVITSMNITLMDNLRFLPRMNLVNYLLSSNKKRWNKWVKVATVKGKGNSDKNEYSLSA